MVTNFFYRPNNKLITTLGKGSFWNSVPLLRHYSYTKNNLMFIFLNIFLYFSFKNGTIYANHLFYNILYYSIYFITSLPVFINYNTLYKFYTIKRLKSTLYFTTKKEFLIRKSLDLLSLSTFYIYRFGNFILFQLYAYFPSKVVKKKKLQLTLHTFKFFYTLVLLLNSFLYLNKNYF